MTRVLQVATPTHGRVVIEDAAAGASSRVLVAFHGYAQNAEDILEEVRRIPGASAWRIVAPLALHRFYARHSDRVVASWMTKQDRDDAIADNVEYINRVIDDVAQPDAAIVCLGFSQGASMAYRAARLGRHAVRGVIALCGDVPPELKTAGDLAWPDVLIGAGVEDSWFTPAKLDADVQWLASRGVTPRVVRFAGGHGWTDEFRAAAGEWLAVRLSDPGAGRSAGE